MAFGFIERASASPMFRLRLFRIRAFSAGVLSSFLAAVARGGLMFMLIIWLQGIWLPEHGYSFSRTPLWAGIYMLPLTAGFLIAGPVSGLLSDRFGSRPFATGGMLVATGSFVLMEQLPINFPYWQFALLLFLNGLAMGAFASPNRAGVMNSLPPQHRGAGSGMNSTFQNSAQVLSIGIFFTLVIVGLSATLPQALSHGLVSEGVSQAGGGPGGRPAAGLHPVRRLPRVQPHGPSPARRGPVQPETGPGGDAARAVLLPPAHIRAVRQRAAHRLRLRRRGLRRRRHRLVVPGQALRYRRRHGAGPVG